MNLKFQARAIRITCGSLLAAALTVQAHDPGLSALTVSRTNSALVATITLARTDAEALVVLDANRDGRVSSQEFNQARAGLETIAGDALKISVGETVLEPASVAAQVGHNDEVSLQLSFEPPGSPQIAVHSALLANLPRGHRQYAVIHGGLGKPLVEKILDAGHPVLEARLPEAAAKTEPTARTGAFRQFLLLGIEHIGTGWDHLIFLLGLLIVGGGFRASVKIITAFTVAHSITLALSTLDVIRLPASVVEPVIAASIIYVGVENLVRREWSGRWMLAFAFGLVHGCGFASVLRELGIGANGGGVLLPLLSFNFGVELGQVIIAALVLPVIWKLKERASFEPRFVPLGSSLVSVAGGYWLVERMLPLVWH